MKRFGLLACLWFNAVGAGIHRLARLHPRNLALILISGIGPFPALAFASTHDVSGIISDPAGRPVREAVVELLEGNGKVIARSVSGLLGRYEISTDATGELLLVVKAAG